MATKDDITNAIKAVADATGNGNTRISLGAQGDHELNSIGESEPTGKAWDGDYKTWPVVVLGLANWVDSTGIGEVGTIKSKLNDLIGQYNQLLSDYNNGVVPSSATPITPIP